MEGDKLQKILSKYDYDVPQSLIAQNPAKPRDSARLLVSRRKTGRASYDTFRSMGLYLPKGSLIVLNQTRVIPARFSVQKETGGSVKLLYLSHTENGVRVLAPKKLSAGTRLFIDQKKFFVVRRKEGNEYLLTPSFPARNMLRFLERTGEAPLPPYISHTALGKKEKKIYYQTVFARQAGSVAAPTASLHFTKRLLTDLRRIGNETAYITLHVGLGTFGSLTDQNLKEGKLHEEQYEISKTTADRIIKAKKEGRPVIAVGTTVVRALESAWKTKKPKLKGETDLFIREGYRFRIVDGMVTNFHVPRSSLLMLVSAFHGRERVKRLYRDAVRRKMRFFSFGDALLLLP